jgi:hypothetical protein
MKIKSLAPWLICLAPTAIALGSIGLGVALSLPMFRLAWDNNFLFELLAIAAVCPLSKIVMTVLFRKSASACMICEINAVKDSYFSQRQLEMLRQRLKHLDQHIRELNQRI